VGPQAYEVFVDGVDPFIPTNPGMTHPVQHIVNAPKSYEFRMPLRTTYPLWCNPAYWHQGLKPFFNLKGQLLAIEGALFLYFYLLFTIQLGITMPFLAMMVIAPSSLSCLKNA